ncbi:MAG: hypothetical protein JWM80_2326 [Cyanobacteria bacterium RYN_339]|nr:hypothetical protein [Cyanobacteria bacterium RYN_339]
MLAVATAAPTTGTVTSPPPTPVAAPTALPHYVGLDPLAQAQLDRLSDELAETDKLMGAGKLASARALLALARREAEAAQAQLLVLKLQPAWTEAMDQLDERGKRLADAWAKGADPESRQLVAAARQRLDGLLAPLERGLDRLTKEQATQRLRAARQAIDVAGQDPLLRGNPAWSAPALDLDRRMLRLEQLLSLRAGQAALADQIAYMLELDASAKRRLAHEDFDGALSDWAALEEACMAFKADLAVLVKHGFDPRTIQLAGREGSRTGVGFLGQVERWQTEAKRRNQLVAEARDPWRKSLTGDRLRVYGMYGVPTWPGAPGEPAAAEAVVQDLWVFYERQGTARLRHEYHFVGDHLQHHELFKEP